jgi:Transposase
LGLYCGIDWATAHHDVAVVDDDGHVVTRGRVGNDAAGFAALLTLLAEAGDSATDPIPRCCGSHVAHGKVFNSRAVQRRTAEPILGIRCSASSLLGQLPRSPNELSHHARVGVERLPDLRVDAPYGASVVLADEPQVVIKSTGV